MNDEFENKIITEVGDCLYNMGVYPNIVGFMNMIYAVISVVKSGNPNYPTCKAYIDAGKRVNRSPSSIERSMRTLIFKCENSHTFDKLNDFIGAPVYHNQPFSAGELISIFALKYMKNQKSAEKAPIF
ncbi:MAG: hypothetical protein IJX05_04330 [Clostridia bacterium]|nr:hypothetical protein [Clostridia bacterium]